VFKGSPMKIHLLPLFLTSLSSVQANVPCAPHSVGVWDQVAYPDYCGFNGELGTSLGFSSYSIDSATSDTQHLLNVSVGAFTMGTSQVIGYSHWFYAQLRENFSYGNTFFGAEDALALYPRRLHKAWFFDSDARLFIPFRVSASNRLSLQPFVGFAIHQAYFKGKLSATATRWGTLLRQRYLAPMAGLALGYNPTPGFAARTSLSVHIPHGKQAQPAQSSTAARHYSTLRMQRHGIGLDLLLMARLSGGWTLTGELDYFAYSALTDSTTDWRTNYTSCLSAKVGASYQF